MIWMVASNYWTRCSLSKRSPKWQIAAKFSRLETFHKRSILMSDVVLSSQLSWCMLLGWITPLITTSRPDVQQCRKFGTFFLMIHHTRLSIPAPSISSYVLTFNSLIVCEDFFIYYLQTMQHVSDSWHSTMGSTAITVVLTFCNENSDLKYSDMNHQEFATEYLEHLHFLYGKSDGNDVNVSTITSYYID